MKFKFNLEHINLPPKVTGRLLPEKENGAEEGIRTPADLAIHGLSRPAR